MSEAPIYGILFTTGSISNVWLLTRGLSLILGVKYSKIYLVYRYVYVYLEGVKIIVVSESR